MPEILWGAFLDAVIDTAKLIPFLYLTYLVMEALERKAGDRSADLLGRVGRLGPCFGGLIGVVPQCGFSAAAASLYSGGVISIGTLLAVFLSTSDEMLPIFISEQVAPASIVKILLLKAAIGIVSGFMIDFLFRLTKYRYKTEKRIDMLCEEAHCGCEDEKEGNIFKAALVHTCEILFFIFLLTLALTIAVELIGTDRMASFLTGRPVIGVIVSALVGLIPNCAASVAITQLYLQGMLTLGQMMAGLLVGAGVGLLVLFRTNDRHPRENLTITGILFCCGIFWGLLIEILTMLT